MNRRALHWVFKVGNRTDTAKFYRDVLGMKFLRHEEFEEGCKASCNGPYDGKWSKSMVGYGPEDDHFVVELTYNYGLGSYRLGNDFQGITICKPDILENAKRVGWPVSEEGGISVLQAPGGYKFYIDTTSSKTGDPVQNVILGSSDLQRTIEFWNGKLGMTIYSQSDDFAIFGYDDSQKQARLKFMRCTEKMDHASAFGRVAFACPRDQLPDIQKRMEEGGETILTPLVSLDTPGKATVEVVILGDPVSLLGHHYKPTL